VSFLEIRSLRKVFPDGTVAVDCFDLDCREGEFVVLLGPSGCGKTTTLRMLAGLERPTGGEIRLEGVDVGGLPASARDVGFVFQFYALYPHMTVRDNIAFPLVCEQVVGSERTARVQEIIDRLQLGRLAAAKPQQLSGGDQQRVALGRAMVRNPQLYLMDEPLGTIDLELRREMRELIRTQQLEAGITTVYVTHDQEEARRLADTLVVMNDGQIRQVATPDEAYHHPADLFVAHFLGSPGMNFFAGAIERQEGRPLFRSSRGDLRLEVPRALRAGPVIVGLRPEALLPASGGPLRGRIQLNEYQGAWRNLHLETDCGPCIARLAAAHRLQPGELLELKLDERQLCFFDPETEARI
jgi:ABC-type sugar transport system ATPase subunit